MPYAPRTAPRTAQRQLLVLAEPELARALVGHLGLAAAAGGGGGGAGADLQLEPLALEGLGQAPGEAAAGGGALRPLVLVFRQGNYSCSRKALMPHVNAFLEAHL